MRQIQRTQGKVFEEVLESGPVFFIECSTQKLRRHDYGQEDTAFAESLVDSGIPPPGEP